MTEEIATQNSAQDAQLRAALPTPPTIAPLAAS